MSREEELEKKIAKDKAELEKIKEAKKDISTSLKPLSTYTDEEKLKWFDETYKYALSEFKNNASGDTSEDDTQYMWESLMEILAYKGKSDEFWKTYNALSKY